MKKSMTPFVAQLLLTERRYGEDYDKWPVQAQEEMHRLANIESKDDRFPTTLQEREKLRALIKQGASVFKVTQVLGHGKKWAQVNMERLKQ